ncbi:MAG: hypothetical protein GY925_06665 [Actinomycetia bacterium]|nr:hypothetical protein [Actinomycetes bacterium]
MATGRRRYLDELAPPIGADVVAGAIAAVAAVIMGLPKMGPAVFGDEFGYLAAGQYLGGGGVLYLGGGTPYHPGFGLFLAPIAMLTLDRSLLYAGALALNGLFAGVAVLATTRLVVAVTDEAPRTVVLAVAVGAVSPGFVYYTGFAMAETLTAGLVALFLLALCRLEERRDWTSAVRLAATAGLSYAAHPRGLVLLGLVLVGAVVAAALRWLTGRVALTAFVTALASGAVARLLIGATTSALYSAERGNSASVTRLLDADAFESVLRVAGRSWYVVVATAGLAVVGAASAVSRPPHHSVTRRATVVVPVMVLIVTAVGQASTTRADLLIYGRYVEATLLPLAALGALAAIAREIRWWMLAPVVLLVAAAGTLLFLVPDSRLDGRVGVFNVPGLGTAFGLLGGSFDKVLWASSLVAALVVSLLLRWIPRVAVGLTILWFLAGTAKMLGHSYAIDDAVDQRARFAADIDRMSAEVGVELRVGLDREHVQTSGELFGVHWAVGERAPITYGFSLPAPPVDVLVSGLLESPRPGYELVAVDRWTGFVMWVSPDVATDLGPGWIVDGGDPRRLSAESYRSRLDPFLIHASGRLTGEIVVTHAGTGGPWLPTSGAFGPEGAVRLVLTVLDGDHAEAYRFELPGTVRPGDSVTVPVDVPVGAAPETIVTLRLVHEGILWFPDRGDGVVEVLVGGG